jgi:NAD(P)-dependent dehydrogenase (short-subunit alcohol dehydrogenase family)
VVVSLKNKVAIVTGGNSGIDQAIVLELARQGANIVIDYVAHPETAEALERRIAGLGDQSISVKADVSKRVELARHNILVVGVRPGAVATPINLSTMQDPAKLAQLNSAIPLGRMARPEEVAAVVGFGDDASYLTATTIFADGGIMQASVGL